MQIKWEINHNILLTNPLNINRQRRIKEIQQYYGTNGSKRHSEEINIEHYNQQQQNTFFLLRVYYIFSVIGDRKIPQ